ncbi:bumetanide-sensitive sodium-(potassium)-chloride cotransporter-like isoform X1 [Pieris brassicae]|uniref:bumetanide-sensitive sodium-(potassium)-chloride cotransporter-like isoform X1 n=1 Tax=Pieris brassicae TaxID=7116 RepID=UPI001E65FF83|nr:bumetanide-sensitive sodium-(potassium)-chloride cotransporter-like isoform X1 [Pieris brassicae]
MATETIDVEDQLLPCSENDSKPGRKVTEAISYRHLNTSELTGTTPVREEEKVKIKSKDPTPELRTYNIKLGWVQGVLIPCLLNIWGVMLFLRIAWIVAQAGIALTIAIICLSGVVCVITTLSLSAICTNGELHGGGVYYIVSRSLGAELGASVGIMFAFANAVAASMNTIGFCESLNDLLKSHNMKIMDNDVNDIRIIGAIALFVMCLICAFGMDWETKTQNFLITIIVSAILNYILGVFIGPLNTQQDAKGFVGLKLAQAKKNLMPDFRYSENQEHNLFSIFAMYFPAVTGVQAGANICGDLKDPATAIPKGTLIALAISISSYLIMATLCGFAALRDASGHVEDLLAGNIDACKPNCPYGLHNNYGIMQLMALSSELIYAGCWAATLSTALTNLLSVPRLIQALGVDKIYPGLIFFSKRYGKHGEPYRGYVLTFLVSLLFLLIADLNTIAPLITNFYLASYALINFCTFHAAIVMSINWRPSFQYYNRWISLFGFLMCIVIMMIISWMMALLTVSIFLTLYLIVLYRKPDVSWGSSTEAQRYKEIISALVQMSYVTENVRTYNPQLLVLAGGPYLRPALLDLGQFITNTGSFMIVANIDECHLSYTERAMQQQVGEEWLHTRKERGFYVVVDGCSLEDGLRNLIQCSGLGRVSPNIMLIGYKNNWQKAPFNKVKTYVKLIQIAFDQQLAVAILRVPLTVPPRNATQVKHQNSQTSLQDEIHTQVLTIMNADSDIEIVIKVEEPDEDNAGESSPPPEEQQHITEQQRQRHGKSGVFRPLELNEENNLDSWWLYDDGGLNVLLSYIIAIRGFHAMPLRIFALARTCHRIEEAEAGMEALLHKFRVEFSCLKMIKGLYDPPQSETKEMFNMMIERFRTDVESDVLITNEELERLNQKTDRYLRLRELVIENSSNASLIVMSLPRPRPNTVSAALYMTWLEVLSNDLPPLLFVRGNDTSVLGV